MFKLETFTDFNVKKAGALLVALFLLNSGYLFAFSDPTIPYVFNILFHVVGGWLCLAAALFFWRRLCATLAVLAVFLPVSTGTYQYFFPNPDDRIENRLETPVAMEEESKKEGPFFPSSASTTVDKIIPSNFFMHSDSCATSGCHPDIYKQWFSSAHHFSSFNNQWYRKSIEYMQEMVGTRPSKWCGGCHDPAVLLNGMMDTPLKENVHPPQPPAGARRRPRPSS